MVAAGAAPPAVGHDLERIARIRSDRWIAYPRAVQALDRLHELFEYPKVGRNDPCPCGSGRKYKQCCLKVA